MVTNLQQLEAVVNAAYGANTDAGTYLEKFFHLRVVLPVANERGQGVRRRYIMHLWNVMGLDSGDRYFDRSVRDGLEALANVMDINLRTLERVVAHVALVYLATNRRYSRDDCLVVGACAMRQVAQALYAKARLGMLTWQEANEFLRLDEWGEENAEAAAMYAHTWRYVTEEELPDEEWVAGVRQHFMAVHYRNRKDLLRWVIGYIDELEIVED